MLNTLSHLALISHTVATSYFIFSPVAMVMSSWFEDTHAGIDEAVGWLVCILLALRSIDVWDVLGLFQRFIRTPEFVTINDSTSTTVQLIPSSPYKLENDGGINRSAHTRYKRSSCGTVHHTCTTNTTIKRYAMQLHTIQHTFI